MTDDQIPAFVGRLRDVGVCWRNGKLAGTANEMDAAADLIERLLAERDNAANWIVCAFCGKQMPRPELGKVANEMAEHIAECEHHPMGKMIKELALSRITLVEVRKWIGDGEHSEGLHREHWTPEYRAVVDAVDYVIQMQKGQTP